ncbi:MAG: hypothetical protein LBJ08_07300, partial [Bifidobacteriaceae bacterium]|nr:hypothetical protein [Bifidobacteriaceae bacterium]
MMVSDGRTLGRHLKAGHREPLLWGRSVGAGLAMAAAVMLARSWLDLRGAAALGLAALLIMAVPTARGFSTRFTLNASVALGATPLLWWIPWPFAFANRTTLLLAA